MKVFKWKKSDLEPTNLLRRIGAVKDNHSYPSYVYISYKKYKEMYKTVYNLLKKQEKYASKKLLVYSTELHMLNYSPCEVKGLPDNIILFDDRSMQREIEEKNK